MNKIFSTLNNIIKLNFPLFSLFPWKRKSEFPFSPIKMESLNAETKKKLDIIAHRGVWKFGSSENTRGAFQKAIEMKCDAIEFDVKKNSLTKNI